MRYVLGHIGAGIARMLCAVLLVMLAMGQALHWAHSQRARIISNGPNVAPERGYSLANAPNNLLDPQSRSPLRVAVRGDVNTADFIAVIVPGIGPQRSNLPEILSFTKKNQKLQWRALSSKSLHLHNAIQAKKPNARIAVIAWLGYQTPDVVGAALEINSLEHGAANLVAFARFLATVNPKARVSWICHSYGALVCAAALRALANSHNGPAATTMIGPPGFDVASVNDLGVSTPIYVGMGDADPIHHMSIAANWGIAFGVDPTSSAFGALHIPCDPGTKHSDYFKLGSAQLDAMARIALDTWNE
jgi:hypothetical protein